MLKLYKPMVAKKINAKTYLSAGTFNRW